ncbi:NYN domain-containing protein [Okeania sp.]|uniref:IS1/IS1595 family N-terminal zinc-binding domain-containing protein n=1 Tax=Okeania sp. TaxID=3100323 RepID=UPI002B4B07E8|nr:NYN domain-containing protein [Okeania sp.]MEB3342694.1 NYN domain-containing protein [Okeania sp.]
MKCPTCNSTSLRKNGRPHNRQRYLCKDCGRQFMEKFSTSEIGQKISLNQSHIKTLAEAPKTGIAILLLDVENLKIDINTEKFLASISEYSLQIKIAFGNWKSSSLSKHDIELFERGYQLIHVPEGKNSADAQMMSMGAAIGRQYSDAKAVFVCSSDWLLTHLCNSLQNQGLTVYRVRRESHNILSVENRNSLEVRHYSLKMATEIPPLEDFVEQIQKLLQEENESISQHQSELSIISSLLEKRYEISVDKKSQQSLPKIVPEEVDILPVQNITTELVENEEYIYSKEVEIWETQNISTEFIENEEYIQSETVYLPQINSPPELEQELMKIISNIPVKKNKIFVDLKLVDEKFLEIFGEDIDEVLKSFNLSNTLEKFVKVSSKFRVKKKPKSKQYQVALAQNIQVVSSQITNSSETFENIQTVNSQIIRSPKELEKALVNIIKVLAAYDPSGYICISIIGIEFHKQYNYSINTIMKQLKLTGKFLNFLKSSHAFNLKKVGNKYKVAIADRE